MKWNTYSQSELDHSFLSPSKPSWLNYDANKLLSVYETKNRAVYGTRLHAFAAEAISLSIRMPATTASLNAFVNDAIGYKMRPEQLLYASEYAYGTADAISFEDESKTLRIHDLKTGILPPSLNQTLVYAALFCLEYKTWPLYTELRVYQNDEVLIWKPSNDEIQVVCNKIMEHTNTLREYDNAKR